MENKPESITENKTFTAILHQTGDSTYSAKCPEVGTESQGTTLDEALDNLKEATEVYLSLFPLKEMGEPIFKTFAVKVKPPKQ